MRISREWLSDYIEFSDVGDAEFEELVTTRVAEVDAREQVGRGLDFARAGFIKSLKRHPKKDKLQIVELILAKGATVSVVSGAPNLTANSIVAYVPPGGIVSGAEGRTLNVEKREFDGVTSEGVLVSAMELGISNDHSGVLVLGSDVEPGTQLNTVYGASDTVLVIDNKSLTHRPDLWSHLGFARELSAILGRSLKCTPDKWADDWDGGKKLFSELRGEGKTNFRVDIARDSKCRRFAALEFKNAKPTRSPAFIERRLFAVGAGVRNILVDLSNYVMHDIGQPNHAYDADALNGEVMFVRRANPHEKFLALDGIERELNTTDIVIADSKGAVALGGIIGGAKSSIGEKTSRILLESANFDPASVRQTTKRHALRTDGSNRFEKSLSAYQVPVALHRFAELLKQAQPAVEIVGAVSDSFAEKPTKIVVPLSFDYVRERMGEEVGDGEIRQVLTGLGFAVRSGSGTSVEIDVPYYRATRDISIPDDLVEEVGRSLGYARIREKAPLIRSEVSKSDPVKEFEYRIRELLFGAGFSEVYNYSFENESYAERLGYSMNKAIKIENPVDADQQSIRTSLVPGLLRFVGENLKYHDALGLYEIGRAYHKEELDTLNAFAFHRRDRNAPAAERRLLALAYQIPTDSEAEFQIFSGEQVSKARNFYAVIGLIQRLGRLVSQNPIQLRQLGTTDECEGDSEGNSSLAYDFKAQKHWMHPYRAATLELNGIALGVVAEVSPGIVDESIRRAVVLELDLELLLGAQERERSFIPFPKYPDSFFEMSVVMPEKTAYVDLERLLYAGEDSTLLRRLELLGVYQGKPLRVGEKSVSVKLYLGAQDRTLSSEDLVAIQSRFMAAVEKSGYSLRK